MNDCICIKTVLHSWFYPLQMDYFLTYYRNKSFQLLFYRSLWYSLNVYIHSTFLCKKIHTIHFPGQKESHFTKETVPKSKSRFVMVFLFHMELKLSYGCSDEAVAALRLHKYLFQLLSDRCHRLKSRCEVLNFHSIICFVVMEGVSGDKS